MKLYRLKKDLPTFSAGDVFELRNGSLYLVKDKLKEDAGCGHWKQEVMAYHKHTLERFPSILIEWFEEIDTSAGWRPHYREKYYAIDPYSESGMIDLVHAGDDVDRLNTAIGNCFKTVAEARKALEWLKAFKVLRGDTKGFKPDWHNGDEDKYSVSYISLNIEEGLVVTRGGDAGIYFRSYADAKSSIERHCTEWLTYLGVEEARRTT